MSRIGKVPVKLKSGISAKLTGQVLEVKGKLGELRRSLPEGMVIEIGKDEILIKRLTETRRDKSLHGLTRTLVQNMVTGVEEGFKKVLQINGVGYRAAVKGKNLELSLGFSHEVKYPAPDGITFAVQANEITVSGRDNQMVGQVAAEIRGFKPPEPYKGKGIFYAGERIIRKAGKAGAKK